MKTDIRDVLEYRYGEELMFMDGFDDCIEGVVERIGQPNIICYDKARVIAKSMEDGMEYDEAEDYFNYNQLGAYVGETTPCFLTKIKV
jgi:hypothetical protein